jgi:hypothetical protein
MEIGFIAIIILILVGIGALVFMVTINRGLNVKRGDYRTYFIVGIAFIPIGIATENWTFTIIGIIFIIIGLTNKNKWQDNQI